MNKEQTLYVIKAKRNLYQFLQEHPEMRSYQEKIEKELENVKEPEKRLTILRI